MIHHRPSHWIAVAVAIALGLIAAEVQGRGSGAPAVFDGRPALAGAGGDDASCPPADPHQGART